MTEQTRTLLSLALLAIHIGIFGYQIVLWNRTRRAHDACARMMARADEDFRFALFIDETLRGVGKPTTYGQLVTQLGQAERSRQAERTMPESIAAAIKATAVDPDSVEHQRKREQWSRFLTDPALNDHVLNDRFPVPGSNPDNNECHPGESR